MGPAAETETKSLARRAFEHWLRTGRYLPERDPAERKFNPYHDPENGRFTFVGRRRLGRLRIPRSQNRAVAPARHSQPAPPGGHSGGKMSPSDVEQHAAHAMGQFQDNLKHGMTVDEAAAWAANSEGESGGDPTRHQLNGGPGRGLYQWGNNIEKLNRRIDFQQYAHVPIEQSTKEQRFGFRDHELLNKEAPAKRAIDAARGAGAKAAAITLHYLRPDKHVRVVHAIDRANIADAIVRRVRNGK